MENTRGVIHACTIEGTGEGRILSGDDVPAIIKADTPAWVHLDGTAPASRSWLEQELTYLDSIIVDALLAEETRPRIVEFDEGVLLILRGVNLNEEARPEDMVSIRLWIDQHRIVSVQRRPLKATKDIQERLRLGKGPKNSGEFIATLASRLFERMEPTLSELNEKLDDIEEKVMETPDISERQDITTFRKQSILLRRYIAPQRDVIAQLRTSEQPWLSQMQKRRLQEALDQLVRYVEDLDAMRERAQIIKDELANALSDRMNKNLYMLSVIAAVFLPLGFLTGLLGINVGGIPGAEYKHAFWLFCGMLVLTIFLQTMLFKKLKWF